jgi:hypothetical protein
VHAASAAPVTTQRPGGRGDELVVPVTISANGTPIAAHVLKVEK